MYKKRLFITLIISFVFIAILTIGITYGFLSVRITGNETAKNAVFNNQIIKVTYSDGKETLISNQDGYFLPGSTLTKTFTITNTGNVPVKYSINLRDITNEFERQEDIVYELTSNSEILYNGIYEAKGIFPDKDTYILGKDTLNINESKTYTLTIKYLTSEENQIVDSGKIIDATIEIDENIKTIKKLLVYGNSIQDGTPSPTSPVEIQSLGSKTKNLIEYPYQDTTKTINGITFKDNGDGTVTANGIATENAIYNIATKKSSIWNGIIPNETYTSSLEYVGEYTGGVSFVTNYFPKGSTTYTNWLNTPSGQTKTLPCPEDIGGLRVYLLITKGTTVKNMILKPKIELGETKTEFEPYNKYKIPVTIKSKNLFDIENKKQNRISGVSIEEIENGLKFTSTSTASAYSSYASYALKNEDILGKTITISADFKVSEGNTAMFRTGYWHTTQHTFKSIMTTTIGVKKNGRYSFTTEIPKELPEFATHYSLFFNTSTLVNSIGKWAEVSNIQVEINDEATEYEPYVEPTTHYIYLDEPLRSVGDCEICSDYIDFKTNQVVRNVGKYIADGNEKSQGGGSSIDSVLGMAFYLDNSAQRGDIRRKGLCNYLVQTSVSTNPLEGFAFLTLENHSYVYIFISKENIEGQYESQYIAVKEFLKQKYDEGNPLNLYYVYNTAIEKKIELPKIESLQGVSNNVEICDEKGICASNIEVEYDE